MIIIFIAKKKQAVARAQTAAAVKLAFQSRPNQPKLRRAKW